MAETIARRRKSKSKRKNNNGGNNQSFVRRETLMGEVCPYPSGRKFLFVRPYEDGPNIEVARSKVDGWKSIPNAGDVVEVDAVFYSDGRASARSCKSLQRVSEGESVLREAVILWYNPNSGRGKVAMLEQEIEAFLSSEVLDKYHLPSHLRYKDFDILASVTMNSSRKGYDVSCIDLPPSL